MISFAVTHESLGEGQGQWVLAVDAERFLVCREDGFAWLPMAECKLLKAYTPDQPLMVLGVQPAPQQGLAVPELNRNMRRGLSLN